VASSDPTLATAAFAVLEWRSWRAFDFCGVTLDLCDSKLGLVESHLRALISIPVNNEVASLRSKVVIALRTLTGLFLSLAAAFILAGLFAHSTFRLLVPFGFVFVLIVLAARFGVIVSVLGSLVAAIVFAHRLYPPLGSIHVDQGAARESLGWMILAAVALSYLLFPPRARSESSRERGTQEPHPHSVEH
jgi:K+-sensing histidine kinase KdpD